MSTFFIGDVALDEYFSAESWPGIADKGFVDELPSKFGGSIANAAVIHAALGGVPEFISLLNESSLSEKLIRDLNENGVSTRHMIRNAEVPESRNLIFLVNNEHVVLTVEIGQQPMWLRPETMLALRQPGYLYTTLFRARRLHFQTGNEVLSKAPLLGDLREHGRQSIFDLDVGGATEEDLPFLQSANVVIFNQVGFRATFGHDDLAAVDGWRRENGIKRVIRTAAAEGAQALDDGTLVIAPGFEVEVTDVTGAGDTFGGALTWGLESDVPFVNALNFAVAAASRSVTQFGPRGGKAHASEVRAFQTHNRR
ncbi:MAG: hypothetical protein CMF72_26085 [Mameliella sp.]|nr:hypothetical protein [Mameliella sp.]|tara:strand:- start:2426 stop:3358 length:933 start_codon:yes stop_codon:yes gene_type:complete